MKTNPSPLIAIIFTISILVGCGGGGGSSSTSSPSSNSSGSTSSPPPNSSSPTSSSTTATPSNPQLNAVGADLTSFKNTFADTTKVNGTVVSNLSFSERFLRGLKNIGLIPNAFAQNLQSCDDNVKPVGITKNGSSDSYRVLQITTKADDKPCFVSSQEVGNFIAAQAKNVYQGDTKCDIVLMPKRGGKLHCFESGIPTSLKDSSGQPLYKFNQAFAGIASLKALGGKITQNGKYFFVAFSDDYSSSNGYYGVYRIDLSGVEPIGQLAYLKLAANPNTLTFDGFQQLENGDLIISHRDGSVPVGQQRYFTYYVGVSPTFPGIDNQQIVLVNSALEFRFDGVNSPVFKWAKDNLAILPQEITDGDSQNIIFSASQDAKDKSFYIVIGVNRYKNLNDKKLLIKGTVVGNNLSFDDFGPTSISFFGTAGISADLSKIYWIKDWPGNPNGVSLVTRNAVKLINPPDYMTEAEVATSLDRLNEYKPTIVYETQNKIFVSIVKSNFYDSNGLMNLRLFAIDKVSGGVDWTKRATDFLEVPLTGFTGDGFRVTSIVPSLVLDKLLFRITRLSDNKEFSLDVSSSGFEFVELGNNTSIKSTYAVVPGK
jgi:hypothetical protein